MKTLIPGSHTHVDSSHSPPTATIKVDSFWVNDYLFEMPTFWTISCVPKISSPEFAIYLRQDINKMVIRELVPHGTKIQKNDYLVLQMLWKDLSRWPTQNKNRPTKAFSVFFPIGEVEGYGEVILMGFRIRLTIQKGSIIEWLQWVECIYKSGSNFLEHVNLDDCCLNKNTWPSHHHKAPRDVFS